MRTNCKNKNLNPEGNDGRVLNAGLKKFGFLFPTTEQELDEFEKSFGDTEVDLPAHLKSPDFILQKFRKGQLKDYEDGINSSIQSLKDYIIRYKRNKYLVDNFTPNRVVALNKTSDVNDLKRIVLAAEITEQLHEETTYGHLKLQKLIFLSQHTCNMSLNTNFLKLSMGPCDPVALRSIDEVFEEKRWFVYNSEGLYKYKKLENSGEHKVIFDLFFSNHKEQINFLIEAFRKSKSEEIEIAATLFACWLELLTKHQAVNEHSLLQTFYKWSDHKKDFSESKVKNKIIWMKQKGITPIDINADK